MVVPEYIVSMLSRLSVSIAQPNHTAPVVHLDGHTDNHYRNLHNAASKNEPPEPKIANTTSTARQILPKLIYEVL